MNERGKRGQSSRLEYTLGICVAEGEGGVDRRINLKPRSVHEKSLLQYHQYIFTCSSERFGETESETIQPCPTNTPFARGRVSASQIETKRWEDLKEECDEARSGEGRRSWNVCSKSHEANIST